MTDVSHLPSPGRPSEHFLPYRVELADDDPRQRSLRIAYDKRSYGLSNGFSYYQRLIEGLARHPRLTVRDFRRLNEPPPPEQSAVFLRHDIDVDPFSAVHLAEALADIGISGSFYVLHTAAYYGRFSEGGDRFLRYRHIPDLLRPIQDRFGCDLGLHVDALDIYLNHGMNGGQAVTAELAWLREQGIAIRSTSAHNSAPIYGAENFEIFKGRAIFDRTEFESGGRRIPLQVLDEAELGLRYEANDADVAVTQAGPALESYLSMRSPDPNRDEAWMRQYLLDNPHCRWGADYNLWLFGTDRWALAGRTDRDPCYHWDVGIEDLWSFLDNIAPGARIVCHLHPLYFHLPGDEWTRQTGRSARVSGSGPSEAWEVALDHDAARLLAGRLGDRQKILYLTLADSGGQNGPISLKLSEGGAALPATVAWLAADTVNLPFDDRSFDLVLGFDVLDKLPQDRWATLLCEVWRVLDHSGWIIGRENLSGPKPGVLGSAQGRLNASTEVLHHVLEESLFCVAQLGVLPDPLRVRRSLGWLLCWLQRRSRFFRRLFMSRLINSWGHWRLLYLAQKDYSQLGRPHREAAGFDRGDF